MLDDGEIDALLTARDPSCFTRKSSNVGRLFENYRQVEESYYQKTGIFPIMHAIILKRDIYSSYPWLAMSLYKAFCDAKEFTLNKYFKTEVLGITLLRNCLLAKL